MSDIKDKNEDILLNGLKYIKSGLNLLNSILCEYQYKTEIDIKILENAEKSYQEIKELLSNE